MLRNAFVFLTFVKAADPSSLVLEPAKKQSHKERCQTSQENAKPCSEQLQILLLPVFTVKRQDFFAYPVDLGRPNV